MSWYWRAEDFPWVLLHPVFMPLGKPATHPEGLSADWPEIGNFHVWLFFLFLAPTLCGSCLQCQEARAVERHWRANGQPTMSAGGGDEALLGSAQTTVTCMPMQPVPDTL